MYQEWKDEQHWILALGNEGFQTLQQPEGCLIIKPPEEECQIQPTKPHHVMGGHRAGNSRMGPAF